MLSSSCSGCPPSTPDAQQRPGWQVTPRSPAASAALPQRARGPPLISLQRPQPPSRRPPRRPSASWPRHRYRPPQPRPQPGCPTSARSKASCSTSTVRTRHLSGSGAQPLCVCPFWEAACAAACSRPPAIVCPSARAGTLTNSDPLHFVAFQEILVELGFDGGQPITEQFFRWGLASLQHGRAALCWQPLEHQAPAACSQRRPRGACNGAAIALGHPPAPADPCPLPPLAAHAAWLCSSPLCASCPRLSRCGAGPV